MFEAVFEKIKEFFSNRTRILFIVLLVLFSRLVVRCYELQILNSEEYAEDYVLKLEKETLTSSARGNIYDRYGNLLAYNELCYILTIEDNGKYDKEHPKNKTLNAMLAQIITNIEACGDQIDNNFGIVLNSKGNYVFRNQGSAQKRFKADVFGLSSASELAYDEKLGYDQALADPDQIMKYLMGPDRFNISDEYDKKLAYEITVIRFSLAQNNYQKYLTTTISSNISPESMAYIEEHLPEFQGVEVKETSIRKYVDSKYFAHIIGYTGMISPEEYEELSAVNKNYERTDVVGKSGIEEYMESYLQGKKGVQKVYVDSMGNLLEVISETPSRAGDDVYLSIDMFLQEAVYELLEQELAGVVYSKIVNAKEWNGENDIMIPIYDVYCALINNMVIDTDHFSMEDASDNEVSTLNIYEQRKSQALEELKRQLLTEEGCVYDTLPEEYQKYSTYVVRYLKSNDIFDSSMINSDTEMQTQWTSEKLSVNNYLRWCIDQNWIDITYFTGSSKYIDSDEIYANMVDYIIQNFENDKGFENLVYNQLIMDDTISGNTLCKILYDQKVLSDDDDISQSFLNGGMSSYYLLTNKIKTLDLTPGQLGLDPCSASSVITDTQTGEILACVTYPGYDNNRMANSVDAEYYYYLNNTGSNPLYNYATQQRTAPGSTFKPISAIAGLSEHVITTDETIVDEGIFTKLNNSIKCWIYPANHGAENLAGAITDSCNYYFNEVGYRLSFKNGDYDANLGIEKLTKYASMFGLNEKTGIEIEEYAPSIATEYPITAAMGQSNHNFTTISLARYVTALATRGTVYKYTLLSKVTDSEGNVIKEYKPEVINQINSVSGYDWDVIQQGMRGVVANSSTWTDFPVMVAGKTGTAQQVTTRGNHALFIGFAPYYEPKVSIATRIAYGYTSHNAAEVSRNILSYYFKLEDTDILLSGNAQEIENAGTNGFTD